MRPVSSSSAICCGSQPVSAIAEPLASRASRKAYDRNGLSVPAQASQADAPIESIPRWILTLNRSPPSAMSRHFEDRVHFDRHPAGQSIDPNRRARMLAHIMEHLDHEVGGAVHDQRLVGEFGRAIDETAQPHAACDTVEIAMERVPQMRQDVEAAEPRGKLSLFDIEFAAKLAKITALAVPLTNLAGNENQTAGLDIRH